MLFCTILPESFYGCFGFLPSNGLDKQKMFLTQELMFVGSDKLSSMTIVGNSIEHLYKAKS